MATLPSDSAIKAYLEQTVHGAADLTQLSRTALKDGLQQYFQLSDESRAQLDEEDHYKRAIKAWTKEAVKTRETAEPAPGDRASEGRDAAPPDDGDSSNASKVHEDESEDVLSEFSSLEDEEPTSKRKARMPKEGTSGRTKKVRTAAGKAGSSLAPEEVTLKRLKAYVILCGTRKPWSKAFTDQGCGREVASFGDDENARRKQWKKQIDVVKDVLSEIGMTPPYSKAKAVKIKEDKEFKQELEAIQQAGTTERSSTRSGRPRRSREADLKKSASNSSESGDDKGPLQKPKAFTNSLAAFAAELNDSE